MIEDKEIKKRELKDRIIVTADLDEKDAPRSRRRQNVNFFAERGRFILLLLALITAFTVVFALINRYKSYDKFNEEAKKLIENKSYTYISKDLKKEKEMVSHKKI